MEVSKATAYIISGVVPNKLYRATHANSEERELWCRSTYVVEIDSTSQKYSCECGLYGHFGIPCCHAISVMLHLGVRCIPQSNLMLRWTKQARYFVPQSLANYTDAGGIAQAEVFRRNVLQTTANELVKMGDANNEAFQILLRYMGDAKKEISKILADKAVAGKVPSDNSEITGYSAEDDSCALSSDIEKGQSTQLRLIDKNSNDVVLVGNIKLPPFARHFGQPSNKRYRSSAEDRITRVQKYTGRGKARRGKTKKAENSITLPRFCRTCGELGHDSRTCSRNPRSTCPMPCQSAS